MKKYSIIFLSSLVLVSSSATLFGSHKQARRGKGHTAWTTPAAPAAAPLPVVNEHEFPSLDKKTAIAVSLQEQEAKRAELEQAAAASAPAASAASASVQPAKRTMKARMIPVHEKLTQPLTDLRTAFASDACVAARQKVEAAAQAVFDQAIAAKKEAQEKAAAQPAAPSAQASEAASAEMVAAEEAQYVPINAGAVYRYPDAVIMKGHIADPVDALVHQCDSLPAGQGFISHGDSPDAVKAGRVVSAVVEHIQSLPAHAQAQVSGKLVKAASQGRKLHIGQPHRRALRVPLRQAVVDAKKQVADNLKARIEAHKKLIAESEAAIQAAYAQDVAALVAAQALLAQTYSLGGKLNIHTQLPSALPRARALAEQKRLAQAESYELAKLDKSGAISDRELRDAQIALKEREADYSEDEEDYEQMPALNRVLRTKVEGEDLSQVITTEKGATHKLGQRAAVVLGSVEQQ